MAISETQKVDYLWKKLAYGLSKTDTNANKRATNESIASPLLLRGANVWAQSSLIPEVIPGSSSDIVTVYPTSSPDETTADSSATLNRTWKTGLIDWISPEFGSTYLVKVYIHTAGDAGNAATSGTQVFGAGSGNNDEWFFDYQSGILHFIGTNLPSGISGKSIYVSGARYTGIKGVAVPGAEASFTNLNITGISTFADNVEISSLTNNRIAIVGSGSTIEDDANLTFDGSTLSVGVDLDVDGHTELDDVNVSTALTANNLVVTGSTLLSHSNSLKLQTTGIGVSISNGVGLTATIAGPTNLIIDPGVVGDNTGIVRIKGDLFVDGEQTQINSTTIELADFIVGVATTATSDLLTDGAGIQIGPNNTFLYEFNSGTNPSLKSSENLNVASGKVYQIDQTERLSADTLSLGTGTTIHSPASNALTFGTNGTEKVRITSDGDVGIGSVIPAGKLDVVGHTELDTLNVSGIATFVGDIATNGNLDVDGRTELDITNIDETLNVVGIATFAELITSNNGLIVTGVSTFNSNVELPDGQHLILGDGLDDSGKFKLYNGANEPFEIFGSAKEVYIRNTGNNANGISINANGSVTLGGGGSGGFSVHADSDGTAKLYGPGPLLKLQTTNSGVIITGVATATTFVGDGDFVELDVDGRTELDITNISETLNVVGIATFANNIDANGDLDVDGRTELDITNISETLNVVGISTFASDIDINASIDVDGRTELDTTNISETLNVVGISTFESDIDINASIDVDGRTELDITNISETLNVVGIATFASNVDLNADLDVDGRTELDITNISETLNVVGISTFSSDIDINASIDVDGHTELDNLNVSGVSTFVSNVNLSSNLDVDGQTDLDVLNVSETATFSSNIDANGNLDVDGTTELDVLNVAETATFSSNIDANGNLDVDGQTDLDVLNVSETATFSSNIDANGDLDVDGHTELDNLNVSGVSTFASAVNATDIIKGYKYTAAPYGSTTTIAVTVASKTAAHRYNGTGSSLGYVFDGLESPFITLTPGRTYKFDQADNSNSSHQIKFYLEADKTTLYEGGVTYNGTAGSAGSYTQIVVGDETPTILHYMCVNHGYMGNSAQVNSNVVNTNYDATLRGNLNVSGITTFANPIDVNGRIVGAATTNVIPFLYSNLSDLPSASTYHGAFAHVHATGKAYYAHAGNWIELVNKEINGVTGTGTENYNVGVLTATRLSTGSIIGPAEIVIDPAAVGDNTGALRIKGDLFVDGTQTVINSTSIELADFIVGIATTATSDILADGAGIGIGTDKFFTFDNSNTAFKSTENLNLETGHTYKINGTDVLSATTIGSGVTNSSLTSLGTIATGVWQGTAINDDYIDTIDNANKVSLSALNIDGGTDIGALLADGDLIIVDDGAGGTNRKADVVGITTYTFSKVSGDIVINAAGAATIQADSVALATDTTGDFVRSISGTANEITVSVTSGENVQPQIGLPDDVTVSNSLKVGTGITAQGGIITATTFVGNGDFVDIDVDGHTELDNVNVAGVSTFAEEIDANGRIVGAATSNVIPFLYSNLSDLPSASTYHGAFAHVHATGKGYYAHAANWIELVNKETTGITGTGVENYNVGVVTATTFDGDINLDNNNITGNGSVNITGIITTTNTLHVGTGGTVISASAETGTFAIGSATTSITATMNGGAIPSIGLVIALGG